MVIIILIVIKIIRIIILRVMIIIIIIKIKITTAAVKYKQGLPPPLMMTTVNKKMRILNTFYT